MSGTLHKCRRRCCHGLSGVLFRFLQHRAAQSACPMVCFATPPTHTPRPPSQAGAKVHCPSSNAAPPPTPLQVSAIGVQIAQPAVAQRRLARRWRAPAPGGRRGGGGWGGGGGGRCRAVGGSTVWGAAGTVASIKDAAGAVLVAVVVPVLSCRCCSSDDV